MEAILPCSGNGIYIYPLSSLPEKSGKAAGELDFMDVWYPLQVKQKDKAGRPDIDMFEAVMMRENRTKGYFIPFDFTSDAMQEIGAFFKREHRVIVPLTVQEILDETIAPQTRVTCQIVMGQSGMCPLPLRTKSKAVGWGARSTRPASGFITNVV